MDASRPLDRPRVLISRAALLNNIRLLRQRVGPDVRICAMVKADAYGHGAALIADALSNFCCERLKAPAADALAVATIDEAAALHPSALPVLILRPVENVYLARLREPIEAAITNGWVLTVISPEAVGDVARIAIACQRRAHVQIMLDTGVAREGAPVDRLGEIMRAIEAQPSIRLAGLCTHFASSEEPQDLFTADQLRRFRAATEHVIVANPRIIRHAANSAAIFHVPASHLDMVRPGISVYGVDPCGRPTVERALRPVLRWEAPLMLIRDVPAGGGVGYNQTWRAARPTRLGLVPIGYADGYLRCFSNRAMMLVCGRPVPVVGRVSMDYTTIDLSDVPQAAVGDAVTVLDDDPLSPASVYALAELAGTIPYEILTRIGPRVVRVGVDPPDEPEEPVEQEIEGRQGANDEGRSPNG